MGWEVGGLFEDIVGMSFGSRISRNLRKEKEKRNRRINVPLADLFVSLFSWRHL
jgi:hypothetical protein